MTTQRKSELIAQLANILGELIEVDSVKEEQQAGSTVEMLTIRECSDAVKGLSEHTVRKLIAQGKLPYIRTGEGKCGKMPVNKADLLAYFGV